MEKVVSHTHLHEIVNQNKEELSFSEQKKIFDFLKKINNVFIKLLKRELSYFLNINVTLICDNIKLNSYCNDKKSSIYLNTINMDIHHMPFYVSFSPNLLFLVIDLLFGGRVRHIDNINKNIFLHSSEYYINKKFIELIIKCYSHSYKDFCMIKMNFFRVVLVKDIKQKFFNTKEQLILNVFKLTIDNIDFFLNIIISVPFIKNLYKDISIIKNDVKNKKKCFGGMSLKDLYPVKLEVVVQLTSFLIDRDTVLKLSIGDVLPIRNPEDVIAYINDEPVFSGKYIDFNERSSVSIDNFLFHDINNKK